jgi:hypothetical protein
MQKKQLNQTTGDTTLTARKEKEVALLDSEISKNAAEEAYIKQKAACLKIKETNAKLEQLRLVYEVKKLEKELRIPDEQAVENVIDCYFRNGPCP